VSPEALIGTWRLVDFAITYADGRPPLSPLGAGAEGLILYAPDGHLSAILSRAGRTSGSAGLEEGRVSVTSGDFVSYAGRWRLEGDRIHHTVLLSLVPEVVGQTLSRQASLTDGLLTLSYTSTPRSGVTRTYRLTWRRPDERPV
jgi:hypothetical protein